MRARGPVWNVTNINGRLWCTRCVAVNTTNVRHTWPATNDITSHAQFTKVCGSEYHKRQIPVVRHRHRDQSLMVHKVCVSEYHKRQTHMVHHKCQNHTPVVLRHMAVSTTNVRYIWATSSVRTVARGACGNEYHKRQIHMVYHKQQKQSSAAHQLCGSEHHTHQTHAARHKCQNQPPVVYQARHRGHHNCQTRAADHNCQNQSPVVHRTCGSEPHRRQTHTVRHKCQTQTLVDTRCGSDHHTRQVGPHSCHPVAHTNTTHVIWGAWPPMCTGAHTGRGGA